MQNRIEIPLSKFKIGILFIVALIITGLCILLLVSPESVGVDSRTPKFISTLLLASALFCGLATLYIGRKFFDNKVGLAIDENGITDNTNATSVGLIDWQDITGTRKFEVHSNKFLLIETDNPDKYIARVKGKIPQLAAKANSKLYGTPIAINQSALKIKFDELQKLVTTELNKRRI